MELSIAYALVGPDGTRVVVGNGAAATSDPDWVGYLDPDNGITGLLDGAEITENVDDVVQGDGGVQGPNWRSRRSGTIQGVISPNAAIATAEAYAQKMRRATAALRGDCMLTWTPSMDGITRRLRLRRQAKPAFPGRRPKTFQLVMASPDPLILSDTENNAVITPGAAAGEVGYPDPITDPITSPANVTAQQTIQNQGDQATWPRFRVYGPITNPTLLNATTGDRIDLTYTLLAGEWLDIYPATGQILLGGTADRYSAYQFATSKWWQLQSGGNDIRLLAAAYAAGAQAVIYWRHAWD
jgi:hypothetical protein